MAGEPPNGSRESSAPPHSRIERWGSCAAHASALIFGAPLGLLLLGFPWALAPCPVVAYMVSRSFRRRRLAWGAFQAMQACVVQLLVFAFAAAGAADLFLTEFAFLVAILLFLYSLAGALDSFLGFDFRYLGIGPWLERVSAINLERPEPRRRWFRRGNRDDR